MRARLSLGLVGVMLVAGAVAAVGGCSSGFSETGTAGGTGGAGGNSASSGSGKGSANSGAGASGAGAGPSSSTGPVCHDNDGDGVTDCAGDCDDNDPLTYPGAPEVCGDGKPNDCSPGTGDKAVCNGIGTYVSDAGSATGTGTQADPVQTIQQGMLNAQTILTANPGMTSIGVYVQAGHYAGPITMVEGISLHGGYDTNWNQDCKGNDTAILCNGPAAVSSGGCVTMPSTITRATTFEGFRVQGFDGTPPATPGTVAVDVFGGSPTITCNRINGGTVTGGSFGSVGLLLRAIVAGPAGPGALVQSNDITGGTSINGSNAVTFQSAYDPNAKIDYPVYGQIAQNNITAGTGKTTKGIGGYGVGGATIVANTISGGVAAGGTSWGIGIFTDSYTVCPKDPSGNPACAPPLATIDKNVINQDQSKAQCSQQTDWCGGIQSLSASLAITNNVVFGAQAEQSAGVQLAEQEGVVQLVIVNSNLLDGAGANSSSNSNVSAALVFEEYQNANNGAHKGITGNVRNNIFQGGIGQQRFGIYEATNPPTALNPNQAKNTAHPNSLDHNDFALDPTKGNEFFYRRWDGTNQVLETVVQCAAASTACVDSSLPAYLLANKPAGPAAPASNDFSAPPNLDATFHLKGGSPCIDTGTANEAPKDDRDGDNRPLKGGFDVGPDERN